MQGEITMSINKDNQELWLKHKPWQPPKSVLNRIFSEWMSIKYPNKEEQFERALKVKKIKLCE